MIRLFYSKDDKDGKITGVTQVLEFDSELYKNKVAELKSKNVKIVVLDERDNEWSVEQYASKQAEPALVSPPSIAADVALPQVLEEVVIPQNSESIISKEGDTSLIGALAECAPPLEP